VHIGSCETKVEFVDSERNFLQTKIKYKIMQCRFNSNWGMSGFADTARRRSTSSAVPAFPLPWSEDVAPAKKFMYAWLTQHELDYLAKRQSKPRYLQRQRTIRRSTSTLSSADYGPNLRFDIQQGSMRTII